MFRSLSGFLMAVVLLLANSGAWGALSEERAAELKRLNDGLQYREGKISLKGGLATVNVENGFRYLDTKDANTVLTKMWGNPPSESTLGLLIPEGMTPLDQTAWAVILSFEADGYVKDDEAAKLDYTKLLKQMQEATESSNEERVKQGYPAIHLVDWATSPYYDQQSHKIYWAKHLRFGDSQEDTLNYCIRALGRRGVLQLNAVASMDQLAEVQKATPTILSMVNFDEGHRYADFNSSTDKVAEYGIAALIAGGILAKTGILKGLLVAILALKKFVVIGAVALFASIKKLIAKITAPKDHTLKA